MKQFTSGPEAGGAGSSYDPATSVLVQAGTNATTDLYRNADGTYTERVYASAVNQLTPAGTWAPVGAAGAAGAASAVAGKGGRGPLPVGFNGSARSVSVLGVPVHGLSGVPKGYRVTAGSLNLFDVAAAQCTAQSTVSVYASGGAVAAGSSSSYLGSAAPATGKKLGTWTGTAPAGACGTSGAGGWISVPFNSAGLSAVGSAGAKGIGFAVEGPASGQGGWKEFAGPDGVTSSSRSVPASPSATATAPSSSSAAPSATSQAAATGTAPPAGVPSSPVPATSASLSSPAPSVSPSPASPSPSGAGTASLDALFTNAAATSSASAVPYVDVTLAAATGPSIDAQYPPADYSEPTLTPQLIADVTASGTVSYDFAVYGADGKLVTSSGAQAGSTWTVKAGHLAWDTTYYWEFSAADSGGETFSPVYPFSTPVPQPLITSSLSQNSSGPGFDAATGDWTTSATDASVATAGPALAVTRDYNSQDPRSSGAFGAGWSSMLDMRVTAGQPGSAGTTQTEVVTYPDGQDVAFGLDPGGTTYSPPQGRYAELAAVSGGFTLTDKNDTVYTFTQSLPGGAYGITSVADADGRTETFTWNGTSQVTQVTSASGRALYFTWGWPSGASYPHVTSVATDPVTSGNASSALTWTYAYSADALTGVCPPGGNGQCTAYTYQQGSDYPSAVLDAAPQSYWRLDDAPGAATAADAVLSNEGTDVPTATGVTFGQDGGPLTGSSATAATFNGSSSDLYLKGLAEYQGAYQSISLWFKTTSASEVLFSMSSNGMTTSTTESFDPVLYIGSDGKLLGEFNNGTAAPMSSASAVNDGQWHNVVITESAGSQDLYVDGQQAADKLTSGLNSQDMTHEYVGAGYLGGSWPDEAYQGQAGGTGTYFNGDISDVAVWSRQLTATEVGEMYGAATPSQLLTKDTRPTGSVAAQVSYDPVTGRAVQVTDASGGSWDIPVPAADTGSSKVYAGAVLGDIPGDYYRLGDINPVNPVNELNGATATYNDVTEGVTPSPALFAGRTVDQFNGSSSYIAMPQGLTYQDGNESVSLWFKTTTAGGTLFSSSASPLAPTTTGDYSGGIYVGSDGKLVGAFFDGNASDVIESGSAVDDGKWHLVVLAADPTGQALYLDGQRLTTTLSAGLDSGDQSYEYVGAGFLGGGWPDEPNYDPGNDTGYASYFTGDMAEVAWYRGFLDSAQVADQWKASEASKGLAPVQTENVTDPGGKTLTSVYDPLHDYRILRYTNGDGDTTSYGYDVRGFQDRVVDPNGDVTDTGYDVRGNKIAEQTCQDQATGACSTARWTYFPDDVTMDPPPSGENDEVKTYLDPRTGDNTSSTAYETSYSYSPAGDLTSETTPPVTGFPNGQTTKFAYTSGTTTGSYNGTDVPPKGLLYQETSPGGAVTTTLYDAAGDVMKVTNPDGLVTTYTYDGLGRVASKTVTSSSYPGGLTTTYSYNGLGQVTQQTDPQVTDRVTGAQHTAVTTTAYDTDGDMLTQTVADTTGGDASRTVTDSYNDLDQLTSQTDAAGGVTTYTYDAYGNKASQTDPNGNVTDYTYDAEGHLLTTTLENYTGSPPGSQSAAPLVEESRVYDQAGRLSSVTDAMGFVTSYGYTDNNLVSSVTRSDPATGASYTEQANTYDAAGNLVAQVTNNGGTTTDYTVNADNQKTSQVLDPSGLDRVTSYAYTPDGSVLTSTVSNGATAVADGQPSGTVQVTGYSYDGTGATAAKFSYGDSDPSLAPSAWYPLDDGAAAGAQFSPATAADVSGNGNTGTVPSTGVSWPGYGAGFSGTSSAPAIDTAGPVVDTSGSFTVSAWVDITGDSSATQGIVAEHSAQEDGFRLDYANGSWEFSRAASDSSGTPSFDVATAPGAATGTWTHVTGTYDASTGAMTLYVNGQAAGTATDSTPFSATGPLAIGNLEYEGADGNPLDGQVGSVEVYPYAMTAAQAAQVYDRGQYGTPLGMQGTATTWSLGERGLATSMTDPDGNTTTYSYDEAGRLAVTTAPATATESYNPATGTDTTVTAHPVTMTGYDTFGDTAETEDADGNVTVYGYDADGRQVSKTLPDYTAPDGSGTYTQAAGTSAVAVTAYDGDGLVTSATDPLGNVTRYAYDQLGNRVSVTAPDGSVTATAYDALGQPLSVTGPTGAVTDTTYDYLGRTVTSTQVERYPSAAAYTTTYSYNASSSDPGGTWKSSSLTAAGVANGYGYDAAGEETWTANGAGDTTDYWYDALGRQTTVINPDGTVTATTYDTAGDVTARADLNSSWQAVSQTSATYNGDGNKTSSTDPAGNTTTFSYNPAGQVTGEVQPVSASSSITTSFGYDAAGNQVRYTDGNGGSWYDTYNSWGLQESRVEPATSQYSSAADSAFTTSYDAGGNAVEVAEPGGVTVTSAYNSVGELTGQSGSGADAATASRSFGYDAAGDLTSASTSAAGGSAATSESFTYDDRGLVLTASGTAGPSSYAYNGDGQVASLNDAAGTTSYAYDSTGRLATLADPLTGSTLSYSYTPDSQVSGISYGSGGDTRTLAYDSLHRLTSDTLATSSGATVASVSYGYSADGLVTSQATTGLAGPSSSTYTYDEAGRLTSWDNGTTTTAYGWDANGNLTQKGGVTYSYDARDELTSDGTSSYACTARGTAVTEPGAAGAGSVAVTSDAYGQQAAAGAGSYTYDALGRLTGEVPSSGSAAQFSYAGATGTIASDGASAYSWTPSGGSLVASGAPGGGGGVLALTDVHGNVVGQFTAAAASLSASQAYDPWGTVTGGSLSGGLGYQSAWADPATGKDLMGARWYNPATGGFTSADTIPQSPLPVSGAGNPFAYAGGNPLENTDPTGHGNWLTNAVGEVVNYAKKGFKAGGAVAGSLAVPVTQLAESGAGAAVAVGDGVAVIDSSVFLPIVAGWLFVTATPTANDVCPAGCTAPEGPSRGGSPSPTWLPTLTPYTSPTSPTSSPTSSPNDSSSGSTGLHIADGAGNDKGSASSQAHASVPHHAVHHSRPSPHGGVQLLPSMSQVLPQIEALALAGSGQGGNGNGGGWPAGPGAPGGGCGPQPGSGPSSFDPSALLNLIPSPGQGNGNSGANQSFTASTRVLLPDGKTVPISRLKAGDKVLASDTKTGKNQAEAVTAVLVRHDTDLYNLTIKTKAGTQVIHTTSNHLFWVPYLDHGWIPAKHLKPGTHLKTPDGQAVVVVGGSVPAVHDGWMWDLTVPGNNDHDFYVAVGDAHVLVHNTDECGPAFTQGDVDRVAQHLSRLDHFGANDVMLQRISDAIGSGQPLTEGQTNFMLHETTEADLMDGGMSYEDAHEQALGTHPPGRNYDPDVIDQFEEFGPWWRKMNGLGPRG